MIKGYNIGDVITFSKVGKHEHEHINGVEQFCLTCTSKRAREQRKGLEALRRDHLENMRKSRNDTKRRRISEFFGWVVSFLIIGGVFYMFALVASIENV